jgi:uncharacterized membrane protein YvlD (DUF360 family)
MIRFLIRTAVFFASALIGLLVADLVLSGLSVDGKSYLSVAIIFALLQAILSPLILKMTVKNGSAFTGGVGIISTFVALFLTSLISSGLSISGASTWILAALIVWLAGAIAAFVLPFLVLKKVVENNRA